MSGEDLLVVLAALALLSVMGALVAVMVATVGALRDLRETVDVLRGETIATVVELRRTVEHAGGELERVDAILDSAERITGTVDSASRLGYRALTPPLIKSMSFVAGTARAARRLRGREHLPGHADPHAIDVASTEREAGR